MGVASRVVVPAAAAVAVEQAVLGRQTCSQVHSVHLGVASAVVAAAAADQVDRADLVAACQRPIYYEYARL